MIIKKLEGGRHLVNTVYISLQMVGIHVRIYAVSQVGYEGTFGAKASQHAISGSCNIILL